MLLIPFDRPIDWRRPPLVTFALVIANVLAFVIFQLDDRSEMAQAKAFYYESGLAAIELPHYRDYLARQGEAAFVERYGERLDDSRAPWFDRLISDDDFLQRLRAGEVIRPGDDDHRRWRQSRERFEQRLAETTVWGQGLRPVEPGVTAWLSHMFLHGGVMHLVGNMLFLIAVGLLVELALGSFVLLGLYLLSGLGAAGLFIGLNPQSVVPLVGASGAISGLMGLCGVLYGLRRIRFFYFIGVYFDYVKAPALVLLGLWLGKEVYQYLQYAQVSGTAYTAHIGGMLTGAVTGTALRFATSAVDEAALDERERTQAFEARLGVAYTRLDAMEPERARPLFERLAREYPDEPRVLDGLFQACRYQPASEAYHGAAKRILALDTASEAGGDRARGDLVVKTYRDYRARAKPRPRLDAAAVGRLIDLLLRRGETAEAQPLVRAALKQPAHFAGIEDQAVRLAHRLHREGQADAARTLYNHLRRHFPGTQAARSAERALTGR